MIVETSALAAILLGEDDAEQFKTALTRAMGQSTMSAAVQVELGILADNAEKATTHKDVDDVIAAFRIEIAPVTPAQAMIARAAHSKYGSWSGSPAKLNFGDCFSYALAMERGEPLLFKGDDFGHTDVRKAKTRNLDTGVFGSRGKK